jgi:Asp-tRNA(Asn)/Glu-tRNA(Gln) amidotransferase A subunit family amidase
MHQADCLRLVWRGFADHIRVTTNPFNTTLTSGGSSGGEGALIGFRGSILGIGSDIGGSIRSPAANNGKLLSGVH